MTQAANGSELKKLGAGTPQRIAITSTRPDSAMSLPVLVSKRDSLAHSILTRPETDFSLIGLATGLCNNPRNPSCVGSFQSGALITANHGGKGFSSVQVQLP